MKKLGTFFDSITNSEYDLYTINALELKKHIDTSYNLTPFKINLFNGSTNLQSEVEGETRYNVLQVDMNKGEILNKDEYFSSENKNAYRKKSIYENSIETSNVSEREEELHHLGYELLPIAITLKNRDMLNLDEVELLDGFRRLFYVKNIPNRDIFVKVYDELSTAQWHSAMLLFNSWKLAQSSNFELFFDRGYKLGLFKHFGIDVTTYNLSGIRILDKYFRRNFYLILKDSKVSHKDIELILELEKNYCNRNKRLNEPNNRIKHFVEYFATALGVLRIYEQSEKRVETPVIFTLQDIVEFMNSPKVRLHLDKINQMSIPGHIDNYVEKHLTFHIAKLIRTRLNLDVKFGKTESYFSKLQNMFDSIEEATLSIAEDVEHRRKLKEGLY